MASLTRGREKGGNWVFRSGFLCRPSGGHCGVCSQLAKSGKPSDEIVDEIFLKTFSRLPHPEERAEAVSLLDTAKDKQPAIEDLVWTLMNSKEFLFSR